MCRFFLILIFPSMCLAQSAWTDSLKKGHELYKKGDFNQALSLYLRYSEAAKAKGGIQSEIAQTYYRLNQYEQALQHYELELKNAKTSKEKAQLMHNIGNVHFQNNDISKAIEAYVESLKLNPNEESTKYNLNQAIRKKNENSSKNNPNQQQQSENTPNESDKNGNSSDPKQGKEKESPSKDVKKQEDEMERILNDLAKQDARNRKKIQGKGTGFDERSSEITNKDW